MKALRRQTDLQSYNLTSCRESYCRREHVGCCSESLKPNRKTEYTWFKISAPIACTDSNLRHSWNHLLQWTCSVPREQKGCQSTWMNHSNPQHKPISWSEERQRTKRWLCATAQMHHRKKIHQAPESGKGLVPQPLPGSEGMRVRYSVWSRLKAGTEASARLPVQ